MYGYEGEKIRKGGFVDFKDAQEWRRKKLEGFAGRRVVQFRQRSDDAAMAYSQIRRAAQSLQAVTEDGASAAMRHAAHRALAALYEAEDHLTAGLRRR